MSTRLSEWPSKTKSDRHFVSEGITQQPGPFYNGNFSSSIWGTPPSPPLWRDLPPSSYGSLSKEHGQSSMHSSFDHHKPVTLSQFQPSEEQGGGFPNWTASFSAGPQGGRQELESSPFAFGFPAPPSDPSSSYVCTEVMRSRPRFRTLEELSNSWAVMLQAQEEVFGSLSSSVPHSLATGQTTETGAQQPIQQGHRNSSTDTVMHQTSLQDQQSAHLAHSPDACPDLAKSEKASSVFNKKDDLGTSGFGSSALGMMAKCETASPLHQKTDYMGTFVFGSSPSSETSAKLGLSQQKGIRASFLGSKLKSSIASTRVKKHINLMKQRSSAAPMSEGLQPVPSQSSMDGPCPSNTVPKFTMGANDTDSLRHPEPGYPGSIHDPPSCQTFSFFQTAASSISNCRDPAATLNVKVQNIDAWAFDKQSNACHPSPMSEGNSLDDRNFVGLASCEWTPYEPRYERRETSTEAAFSQGLGKPSMETNKSSQESKLTECDINSSGKLSAEDLGEKAVKGGKFGEEIKRQKENQEPNFSFGSQKGSRPFVFGSSRTTRNTKHTALSTDAMMKKDHFVKGAKDNTALELLIAKLGEKLENLGKSHDNLTNQETISQLGKKLSILECSSSSLQKDQEKKSVAACSFDEGANVFAKGTSINYSMNELCEKLFKLGTLDDGKKSMRDPLNYSSGTTDNNAVGHAIKELRDQISKLGPFDDKRRQRKEETAKYSSSGAQYGDPLDSGSIVGAVEEIREEIARLGREETKNQLSSSRLQECDTFVQSVEELRRRLESLGKVNEKGQNCNFDSKSQEGKNATQEAFVFTACSASAQKDFDSARLPCFKAFPNYSGDNSIKRPQLNPFINANSTNLFSSHESQTSSSFPIANPLTGGQPSSFQNGYNGVKLFSFERSGNDQGSSSFGGFEFHGAKSPPKGTCVQRKSGKACPNSKSREEAKVAGSRRSARFTSTLHNPGSPMDFSPCADKAAPSSSVSVSNFAGQEFVQTSPESESDEVVNMNVEDIRIATANLTVGNDKEGCEGKQTGPGLSGGSNIYSFLRQKKGTWKRVSKKGTYVSASTKGPESQMPFASSCDVDRGMASSFLSSGLPSGIDAREKSQSNTMWNSSSASSFKEVQKSTLKAVSERTSFSRKFGEPDKEQQASAIARETAASFLRATERAAAEQTCEKWRLRGNQSYAKGDYEKAEDFYTRGAGSVLPGDTSESCIRASMLCYSNRAATRMAVGRMREALADCKKAMLLDSTFLRVRLRAASCHLALGESKAAAALFTECWSLAQERNSDFKIMEDAMEGVRKSQSFDNLLKRASEHLRINTCTDASAALQLIDEALEVSPLSEAILGLKAQALFLLRRFGDVLQLCEKTLPAAIENHDAHYHDESLGERVVFLNLWRWRMCGKSLFQLGKLEESLSLLTKYEEATSGLSSNERANIESMTTTVFLIRDLLRHKAAGNEAFQAGRHADAVDHYTAALSCNNESRPYNAVCFCNRAAASQALGNIADAIADCSRAIVLDPFYAKAISRRATLHEIIRDFGQTCNDLKRLITLLEGQEAVLKSPKTTRAASKNSQDLRQARERLEKATKEIKKDTVVDHYVILGLDASCCSSDVKKAYRKAALKHHPDKAGQFLVRGENGDDGGLWKEVGDEVRKDAERLFKLIGEAYGILSDPAKRAQYDLEHHMSKTRSGTYQGYSNTDDPYEKSGRQYYDHKDGWSGHSPRYQRWQNGPDAAQRDTYSERGTRDSSRTRDRRQRGRRSDYYSWDEY